jgi:hypothetical protein
MSYEDDWALCGFCFAASRAQIVHESSSVTSQRTGSGSLEQPNHIGIVAKSDDPGLRKDRGKEISGPECSTLLVSPCCLSASGETVNEGNAAAELSA